MDKSLRDIVMFLWGAGLTAFWYWFFDYALWANFSILVAFTILTIVIFAFLGSIFAIVVFVYRMVKYLKIIIRWEE